MVQPRKTHIERQHHRHTTSCYIFKAHASPASPRGHLVWYERLRLSPVARLETMWRLSSGRRAGGSDVAQVWGRGDVGHLLLAGHLRF
jgi:hypothetical protein